MTQYIVQIQTAPNGVGIGWLAKSFEVTPEVPIPPPAKIPSNRVQIPMTNTTSFDQIVAVYGEHRAAAIFSYDEGAGTISCSGAHTQTWPIN